MFYKLVSILAILFIIYHQCVLPNMSVIKHKADNFTIYTNLLFAFRGGCQFVGWPSSP